MHSLSAKFFELYCVGLPGWWPSLLQWPFPPGVFIAILGCWAAIVTLFKEPTRPIKALYVFLFFALMCGEIFMLGRDRDARERTEKESRDSSERELSNLALLTHQVTTTDAHIGDLKLEIDAAKGNPQILASLQAQVTVAKSEAAKASRELLIATTPGIAQELHDLGLRWYNEDGSLITIAATSHSMDPDKQESERNELTQKRLSLAQKYLELAQPSMLTADYLRQQLIQQLGPSEPTTEDRNEAAVFARAVAGQPITSLELSGAGSYLLTLSKRVAAKKDMRS
jgi:hypothetical protein